MSEAPPFTPYQELPVPSPETLPEVKVKDIRERIESTLKRDGFEAAMSAADEEIHALEFLPQHFCMTRHVLESVRRSARLAPDHVVAAEKVGLKSPEEISRDFIRLQLKTLKRAYDLDRRAFPIQTRGIPILCQDVPRIE
jgi:hypothetical protein